MPEYVSDRWLLLSTNMRRGLQLAPNMLTLVLRLRQIALHPGLSPAQSEHGEPVYIRMFAVYFLLIVDQVLDLP